VWLQLWPRAARKGLSGGDGWSKAGVSQWCVAAAGAGARVWAIWGRSALTSGARERGGGGRVGLHNVAKRVSDRQVGFTGPTRLERNGFEYLFNPF
jgi:hypothetical protein